MYEGLLASKQKIPEPTRRGQTVCEAQHTAQHGCCSPASRPGLSSGGRDPAAPRDRANTQTCTRSPGRTTPLGPKQVRARLCSAGDGGIAKPATDAENATSHVSQGTRTPAAPSPPRLCLQALRPVSALSPPTTNPLGQRELLACRRAHGWAAAASASRLSRLWAWVLPQGTVAPASGRGSREQLGWVPSRGSTALLGCCGGDGSRQPVRLNRRPRVCQVSILLSRLLPESKEV